VSPRLTQVPALVKAGYRVIAPDLRGFGSTDKPQVCTACGQPTLQSSVTMQFTLHIPLRAALTVCMLHVQEVADYDFVELLTDIIYILATLGAPPQLTAIVAHDYGAM
jgi:pimeloyl-ACP methyl ester carboxylesterase